VSISDGELTGGRWHVPAGDVDAACAARLQRRSRSELTSALEDTLRGAVRGALLADASVGSLCSGGVDSSLITALAVEAKPDLVAFGATYAGDGRRQEGPAARRVADALGIELELVDVTPGDFRRGFVPATVHHGGPIANASAVTVSQLADHARRCGVKVLLTGEGADELFGGYGSLHGDALTAFLPWGQRVLRRAEPKLLEDPWRMLDPARALGKIWRLAHSFAAVPGAAGSGAASWSAALAPDTGPDASAESLAAYGHHAGDRRALEAGLLSRLDYTLCWLLNRMDKNIMQASVEARVPFLEPQVVRLVLNLPLEARVGPWSKGILRDVARRLLPWSIAHRPKIYGMAFNAGAWIAQAADPRFLTDGLLKDKLQIPTAEFDRVTSAANGHGGLRLWSAEVWSRSVLAGDSIQQIEQALWR
jgi:asparagine synthase (glutamine-hydrolysing)